MEVDVPAAAEGRLALAASFAAAARRYWLGVFPRVSVERRRRRARALEIPDPLLRATALDAQRKWGNIEGAVAFAAFVPHGRRAAAVRAMSCFQVAYNYLDMLSEQPSADPAANGRRLHSALLVALDPDYAHHDYYEHHPQREDGGYLPEIIDACRAALATLPSYPAVAPAARAAAERIVAFQSCNTGERQGDCRAGALGARADPARGGPALVGDRGRRRLLAVRLRADRPRPARSPRRLAGFAGSPEADRGAARTPTFRGSARCTRCWTTWWT